ncbi:sulphate transporter [Serratia sp. AS12]|uniref:SulP family inorganic anion transporter n=1 Tax=Serratia TaxID=613 RepID=UPI00020E96BF|nr:MULTISPECIES: SulP family inorganic anion transporter [Serratia]AEF43424.1 sulphate transporter [Serratia plymuthica AS9]AEF48376.1 sulphate transporter [Serratia sp. AS12]AEG26084.1 sulphate transporter [Serratia sp. AS13]UTN96989.1 SulP family inorganic anion transporter [Serratia plymuthica]
MNFSTLRNDIPAGIVVFLVALPLSLGIAQASGLPPFVGLLTGVIGGIVVTLLSPSRYAVSGPAAGLVTIVTAAMETLGSFSLLLVALMLAGALQLIFGLLRAGRWITLVPGTVIQGMLVAIGILLIMQQVPVALGVQGDASLKALLADGAELLSPASALVALGALLIMWLWTTAPVKRIPLARYLPGPLVAVLWGSLAVVFGERWMPESIGAMPRISLPKFDSAEALGEQLSRPDWQGAWRNPSVYLIALTLALVASLETLLSQEALKKLKSQTPAPSPDKEMRAQGVGNMLSGFLGGLPITAVIVRSSVNVNAGARSRISILLHGVLLLLCGLFFSDVLNTIPLASLAAVLLYTGYKLASPALFIAQWRQGLPQFIPFILTLSCIVIFGMLAGIAIGLMAQLLCSTYKSHRNALQLSCYDDHYVVRFHQNLTFLHNPRLQSLLAQIPDNCVVIAEHDNAEYIDPDVRAVLAEFGAGAAERGIQLSRWPAG